MYSVTINKEQVCRKKKQKGKAFDFLTGIGEKKKREEVDMDQEIIIKDAVLRAASEGCLQQKRSNMLEMDVGFKKYLMFK